MAAGICKTLVVGQYISQYTHVFAVFFARKKYLNCTKTETETCVKSLEVRKLSSPQLKFFSW